jgi:hypothetical protein
MAARAARSGLRPLLLAAPQPQLPVQRPVAAGAVRRADVRHGHQHVDEQRHRLVQRGSRLDVAGRVPGPLAEQHPVAPRCRSAQSRYAVTSSPTRARCTPDTSHGLRHRRRELLVGQHGQVRHQRVPRREVAVDGGPDSITPSRRRIAKKSALRHDYVNVKVSGLSYRAAAAGNLVIDDPNIDSVQVDGCGPDRPAVQRRRAGRGLPRPAGTARVPDRAISIVLNGGLVMPVWAGLTPQEWCVLLAAGESSLLYELLSPWRPASTGIRSRRCRTSRSW